MTAGGRSEYVPKTDNNTPMWQSENRRTEIIVLPKLDQFMQLLEAKDKIVIPYKSLFQLLKQAFY